VESSSVSVLIDGIPTAVIIAQDISERKEKERKLQIMQFSIDNALDRIAWMAPDGRFLYANKAACKEMGYPLEEVLSMRVSDINPNFPIERWTEHYREVKKRDSMRLETQQIDRDGQTHDIEVSANYLKFGGYEFMCSFGRDITERRQKENEIKQYKHIVESTNNPIGLVDRNFIYQYVNEPYCQALKRSANEIIGHSVTELFGRNFFETVMEPHYKQCFSGENVSYQEWYDFPGWGRRYMDVRYYPFREADGRVTAVVTNVHDITEIKNLELKLERSEELFRAFMDYNPAVAYIKDKSYKHVYGNQTLFDAFNISSSDQFFGTTADDFFPADIAEKIKAYDKKVFAGRIIEESEEFWDETRGQRRWWKEVKFPFTDYSGETMIGGLAFNITKIKQAEERLKKAYNEIKELKDRTEQENVYLREEIEVNYRHKDIVGESAAIKYNLNQAERVAKEQTTVLILGETGTGKELLARAIHRLSPRKARPLVKVNCAALPINLVESELFGREKGAFTGAMSRQIGRFETADGSTILLDEIGDLPLELQTKLLRVLQEGQFERLGSNKTISVDVRVIAATNRDLRKAVREGRFRKDLYYRLNIFPITVHPLRDRREDIPLLTWAFVKEYTQRMGKQISSIEKKGLDRLKTYSWPGNVRELKNVIERSMILNTGLTLRIAEFEPDVEATLLNLTLEEMERNHILKVLENTGWRVRGDNGAAGILGLKATTLESRMKKLGVQRKR
jgi:PAS domain S-box-containing protein